MFKVYEVHTFLLKLFISLNYRCLDIKVKFDASLHNSALISKNVTFSDGKKSFTIKFLTRALTKYKSINYIGACLLYIQYMQ